MVTIKLFYASSAWYSLKCLIRSGKPIVPPLTRLVIEVTTASVAPPSAILCKPFLLKNHAADASGY